MCTDHTTGETHALKKMPKKYTDNASFQREIVALLRVRESGSSHPNICELKENFEENENYYLVLDLISGGEMFDHLAENGPYSEADAAHLVRETASALAFIHGVGLVHGDLKPENLMLSTRNISDSVIKLGTSAKEFSSGPIPRAVHDSTNMLLSPLAPIPFNQRDVDRTGQWTLAAWKFTRVILVSRKILPDQT